MLARVRREFAVCRRTQRNRQHLDIPTSGTPTLPYTAKQGEEIVDILERNKCVFLSVHFVRPPINWPTADRAHSPGIITYVAKLWTIVGKFYASTKVWVPLRVSPQKNIASHSAKSTLNSPLVNQPWRFQMRNGVSSSQSYRTHFFWDSLMVNGGGSRAFG
jgi:hypothetical protein